MLDGPLIDFCDADVRCEVELEHATLLGTHGMDHLGLSQITADTRPVTQTIAADRHDRLSAAGIRSPRLDGNACVVVFEDRGGLEGGRAVGAFAARRDAHRGGQRAAGPVEPAVQAIDAVAEQAQHAPPGAAASCASAS